MARDGVAVDAQLAGLVARVASGEKVNVSAQCLALGISRQQFYKYLDRFRNEGVEGFFPRSRRPRSSPTLTSALVEDAVVRARKRLAEEGLDNGAISVRWWLLDHVDDWAGTDAGVPSRATVHRILLRRGLVTPAPAKRPRRAGHRFSRDKANDLWQMDGFETRLAGGARAVVIEILDDHTRKNLVGHAARSENAEDAWVAFTRAAAVHGLPRQLLTDNGTAFSGRRRGFTSDLEAAAAALGVQTISATVSHPQTCGKVERGHATAERWLRRRAPAPSVAALGDLLEEYRAIYNERRHQSLAGLSPNQAWAIAERAGPAGAPLPDALHVTTPLVGPSGGIGVDNTEVGIGRAHAGARATVFRTGDDVTIFVSGTLIRQLVLDRTRRYQPLTAR